MDFINHRKGADYIRFSFEVKISEQDNYAFNLFTAIGTKQGRKNFNRNRVCMVAFVVLFGVLLSYLIDSVLDVWMLIAIYAVAAVVAFLGYRPYMKHIMKRLIIKAKENGRLPYSPEATITFSDENIFEQSSLEKIEYQYSIVEAVYLVNDSVLYIYTGPNRAFILPVSAFTGTAQLDGFKAFIAEKTVPLTVCQFHA